MRIESISTLHKIIGYEKPKHPLITLIDFKNLDTTNINIDEKSMSYIANYYMISLKNCTDCILKYGRKYYDFEEGSLIFTSPGQKLLVEGNPKNIDGWMLCFHPDLIRGSTLESKIDEYSFFSYDTSEALHLSQKEKDIINNIANTIKLEYTQNIDVYSKDLIVSNIEVLLNYAKRFYGRQFITRTAINKDLIVKFEQILKNRFKDELLEENGIPTVKELAMRMGYSTNYLGDLLKKETGKSTQEHIQFMLLERAKSLLVGSNESVSQIAYSLGFEYPAHFSKFFKSKTGISPVQYRKIN
jgi:AraC-like DNA-binding protein